MYIVISDLNRQFAPRAGNADKSSVAIQMGLSIVFLRVSSYTFAVAEICKCVRSFAIMRGDLSLCLSSCTADRPPVGGGTLGWCVSVTLLVWVVAAVASLHGRIWMGNSITELRLPRCISTMKHPIGEFNILSHELLKVWRKFTVSGRINSSNEQILIIWHSSLKDIKLMTSLGCHAFYKECEPAYQWQWSC